MQIGLENNTQTSIGQKELEYIAQESKRGLINPIKIISFLVIISGLFALIFEVNYFIDVSIYVYAFRFFVITIAFWVLIISGFDFGEKYPNLLAHSLLISILLSFGGVIIFLPNTLIINSQITALIIFSASLFLSWEVKNQILVAIYYNIIFGFTLLMNTNELYLQQNLFATMLFVMFLSLMSIAVAAINSKYRKNILVNTLRLLYTKQKFKEIFEKSSDGIFQANLEGEIYTSNNSLKKHLALPTDQEKIFLKENYFLGEKRFKEISNLLIHTQKVVDYPFELVINNGETKYFYLNCRLHYDTILGKYLIEGTVRDITPQHKVEETLRQAKEKAEESNRLKSEFLSLMSHEIRTPINAILSSIEYLQYELQDKITEDIETAFKIINSSSNRIIRTIHLVLNLAEVHTGIYKYLPSKFDLYRDCILLILQEYDEQIKEKEITIRVVQETFDCALIADEYSINQIFKNVIDNAIKYTHNGTIEIIIARDDDNRLNVKVKDTGIGISEEYLPNLFSAFTQEHTGFTRKYDGNGLGLALVKKYCELNNAIVNISSVKREGTTVTITFHSTKNLEQKIISSF